MKIVKMTSLSVLLLTAVWVTGIYTYSVPKIEGGTQPLSVYQGKKLLIITLPVEGGAAADSMLYSLDTLAAAHLSTVSIIGVPSYEDGFTPAQKTQLEQWYRSKLGNYIVITDGLYSRKTSGSQQHGLFKWLTDVELNQGFDTDVTGSGYKFFVNASGELYGVLKPQTKISSQAVQKTLLMQ